MGVRFVTRPPQRQRGNFGNNVNSEQYILNCYNATVWFLFVDYIRFLISVWFFHTRLPPDYIPFVGARRVLRRYRRDSPPRAFGCPLGELFWSRLNRDLSVWHDEIIAFTYFSSESIVRTVSVAYVSTENRSEVLQNPGQNNFLFYHRFFFLLIKS